MVPLLLPSCAAFLALSSCRVSERPVVVPGVYAKSDLNVLRGAVSAKGAQIRRHSQGPVQGVV